MTDRPAVETAAGTTAGRGASILPLEARGLIYRANGQALVDGVSLVVPPGSFTVVLGPNGAGKSLLLRLLHGLIAPTAGEISWSGSVADPAALRRRQAMVFQRPVLLRRSVEANILYALKRLGIPRRERPEACDEALRQAGLTGKRRLPARLLSVGEQQRLVVARALAGNPDIMFLDEPTASLDPASVLQIEELLRAANRAGMAVVLVTHDVAQARRLARQVVFLHQGRLAEQGDADSFFDSPGSVAAQAYLAGKILI